MRAPRWLRVFCAWRWAPCVSLPVGSLAFIALVLLLMPAGPISTPQALSEAARPAFASTLPRAPASAAAAREPLVAPDYHAAAAAPVLQPEPPPLHSASEAPPEDRVPPIFSANIADRGDRPQAPSARP